MADVPDVGNFQTLGLRLYRYRYVWDDPGAPPHIGVMADEVERLFPEAMGPTVSGFQTVDYDKLAALVFAEDPDLAERIRGELVEQMSEGDAATLMQRTGGALLVAHLVGMSPAELGSALEETGLPWPQAIGSRNASDLA